MRAFPTQTHLTRVLGLTILAALTSTCTSNVLLDRLSPPAALLAFTVDPSNATAGVAITPAVVVEALDVSGNLVSDFSGDVTLTIDTSLYAGSLSGTVTKRAIGGQAKFTDLSVDKAGAAYMLRATSGSLMAAHSTTFDIAAGPASRLAFPVEPSRTLAGSSITAGSPITPALQVSAEDALGNTVTSFSGDVTLVLASNPTSATLSGTTTVGAVGGVASFSTLSIDKAGAGYRFQATSGTLTPAYGPFFVVDAGPASRLVCTGGMSAIQVTVEDAFGNTVTGFTGNVTATLGTNPTGATLSGTTTVAAVAGIATFSSLLINLAGSGYTIIVSAGGLTATCGPFTIAAGHASRLLFTVQPTVASAGAPITPALQVSAEDALGHVDQTFTGTVTVSLGANPTGATLSGTMALAAVGGVATFSTLTIDKVGSGYTLVSAAVGLTSDTSVAFNNITNECCQLVFTVQPTTATAGAVITPPVQVSAMDAAGNTATNFVGNVTVAFGTNPSGGTLSGTLTRAAVAGVATFSNLSIDKAGTGYTLFAASAAVSMASSVLFNVTAGAATRLVFTAQPTVAYTGTPITPALQVSAENALGSVDQTFTGTVRVSLGANPTGAPLSGTTSVAAAAGVATFSNLTIDMVGNGYTLVAAAAGLTSDTSVAFNTLTWECCHLVFSSQPTNTAAGATITPPIQVTNIDGFGNADTNFVGNVTMAIGANPSGGLLSGTLTRAAVRGVATFSDLSIDKTGMGYTLTAVGTGATAASSVPFNIK